MIKNLFILGTLLTVLNVGAFNRYDVKTNRYYRTFKGNNVTTTQVFDVKTGKTWSETRHKNGFMYGINGDNIQYNGNWKTGKINVLGKRKYCRKVFGVEQCN